MNSIPINEPELLCLDLFRVALSEDTQDARTRAIAVMRHEVVSLGLENFPIGADKPKGEKSHPEFVQWVAETSKARYDAAHEYEQIVGRYEARNERKLNIAEYIGKCVWDSIQNERFQGLQVPGGILEQAREEARSLGVKGGVDKDAVRKIWNSFRGVVHLGMAMDYCEDNPKSDLNVLHLAEIFRKGLSQNCPKGTKKPYVNPDQQISFLYLSNI